MKLSPELMQAIMNYLASKPYAEVFQLINAIQAESVSTQEPVMEQENGNA